MDELLDVLIESGGKICLDPVQQNPVHLCLLDRYVSQGQGHIENHVHQVCDKSTGQQVNSHFLSFLCTFVAGRKKHVNHSRNIFHQSFLTVVKFNSIHCFSKFFLVIILFFQWLVTMFLTSKLEEK